VRPAPATGWSPPFPSVLGGEMFGCMRRIGCLVVLVVACGVGYLTRDLWLDRVRGYFPGAPDTTAVAATSAWESLSPERAERGERAVRALARNGGPVYVTLRAGELASYAFLSLAPALPPSARDAESAVIGDRVYVRALVSLRELGGAGGFGALGGVLADRDTLRLGGTFDVLRPGLAQFHVQDVQLGAFPVPARMIPALVKRVRRGREIAGLSADALAIPIPDYIGDVRVARGRITLYKNTR
jgi:hypothetical protein